MRAILVTALLLAPLMVQAAVYRSVDEQGNVVYTDQPVSGAEQVELPGVTTYTPVKPTPRPAASSPSTGEAESGQADGGRYRVNVVSPASDSAFWDSGGVVPVQVQVQPQVQFKRGHRLALRLDDQPPVIVASTAHRFDNVDRGAHVVQAWVVGPDERDLSERHSVRFQLHRQSQLNNPLSNAPGPSGGANVGGGPVRAAPRAPQAPRGTNFGNRAPN